MQININYISRRHYKGKGWKAWKYWLYWGRSSNYIFSKTLRLFGVTVTIKEDNSFNKLIKALKNK